MQNFIKWHDHRCGTLKWRSTAMVVETTEQAKELIQVWMNDRGFFDPVLSPNPTPEGFHFVLGGKAANDIPFSILQPSELKRTVAVMASVTLSKEHFDAFNSLKKEDADNLLWDLQKEVMFASPAYSFNPEYKVDGTFKGIQFIKDISYDELTEGKLGDAVSSVTKCVIWVIWTFGRAFGSLE
jgi:hypothetical protein